MTFLKVFTDFAAKMETLGDAERGRLFTAMLKYAETGEAPELKGNEKFLWAVAKYDIDRQFRAYQNKVDAAAEARKAKTLDNNGKQAVSLDNSLKTSQEKDKDKDKDKEKEKTLSSTPNGVSDKKKKIISSTPNGVSDNARARRPTVEEVAAYCRERGNSVDAERFVDFYTAKGWKIGKDTIKDWKACVRTWEKRDEERKPKSRFATPDYDSMEDLPV